MEMATGSRGRFVRLYEDNSPRLLAYALRRVGDREEARDIVAETFAVVWRRIDDVPEGRAELAWVFGVARRVVANHRRSGARFARLQARLTGVRGDVVEEGDDPSLAPEALAALARLSPRHQEVLRLAAWEQLSQAEIAAVLHCSPNAVAIRLHRARRALQAAFERELGSGARLHAPRPGTDQDPQNGGNHAEPA